MPSLQIIYASTSGHTEYVVQKIADELRRTNSGIVVHTQRAENATAEDLQRGDALLLGSGTWNTGGIEGQLNPHMHEFLHDRANHADLKKKNVFIVSLGDDRYRYTTRAGGHLRTFAVAHGGIVIEPILTIVNEPYDKEAVIVAWTKRLAHSISGA